MKYKGMKLLGLLSATTAATLAGAGEAKAIDPVALDTFEVSGDEVTASDPTTSSVGSTDEIIGGSREVTLLSDDSPSTNETSAQVVNGLLNLQSDNSIPDKFAGEVRLDFDGSDDGSFDNSGLGGIDLTDGGNNNGIKFEAENDPFFADATVTLFSDNGSFQVDRTKSFEGDSAIFFDFDTDFSGDTNNFNPGNLSAARITLTADANSQNPTIAAVGATQSIDDPVDPEPIPFEAETSIGLALLGAWGSYKYWKRKQKAS